MSLRTLRSTRVAIATALVLCLCVGPRTARAEEGAPSSGASGAKTERRSNTTARAAGWVAFAIGVEATIIAVATSFMMLHSDSVREDECDANKRCTATGLDANGAVRSLAPWNAGAWAVAAVGLGVGTWLVLSNPPDGRRTEVGVGPGGVGLRGSF